MEVHIFRCLKEHVSFFFRKLVDFILLSMFFQYAGATGTMAHFPFRLLGYSAQIAVFHNVYSYCMIKVHMVSNLVLAQIYIYTNAVM